ncbi:hypothetical protein UlMin_032860 [Ulmus minor]
MDCMEAKALRPSFHEEILTQQVFVDEICTTGISCLPSDDFSIDDLLDLPNGEFEDVSVEEEEEEKDFLLVEEENSNSGSFSGAGDSAGDFESSLASELAVPDDDIAELEWVSHFVDDYVPELPLLYPVGKQNRPEPEPKPAEAKPACFTTRKTRKRRTRPGRAWFTASLLAESSSSSSTFGFSSTPCLIFANTVQNLDFPVHLGKPAAKKQKRKPAVQSGDGSGGVQPSRRCSHCLVQKTPQWRAGPLGAKTLCNACGVRFKSGRLYPEYRPACSPTFSSDLHSNSHRKVLEMRKNKETVGPETGLTQMISSF